MAVTPEDNAAAQIEVINALVGALIREKAERLALEREAAQPKES